jgi:hydrogenase maturation protease
VKRRITIGGVGSVLLGDDGVGPYVIRLLEANYLFEDCITVLDLGTPGLDLVAHVSGMDALILIDSVENGAAPGTVTLYRREDILRHGPAPVRMDGHSPALAESLMIAELAGECPKEIALIGITGEQYEAGAILSDFARQAASGAAAAVLAELDRLGAHCWKQSELASIKAWWELAPEEASVCV